MIRHVSRLAVAALLAVQLPAEACTRFVYAGAGDQIITGRSMDWKEEIGTNLWVLPRGMERSGAVGPASVKWTSRYGSVVASAFDIATSDGMNEAGLVANVLWLVESEYPEWNGKTPGIATSIWAQYMLDNFATVAEAVAVLEKEPFTVVTDKLPGTKISGTVHLALSDASGDSAIIEYIGGKQVIHHGKQFNVLTNSPPYDQQLALVSYWRDIGGTVMLPGTNRAADRFARADFYVRALPRPDDPNVAVAAAFSVIRNVSVPLGISTPNEPNISSTRWRTVSDHQRKLYFFESARTPNTFWVDLSKLDFSPATGKVMKLELGPHQSNTFAGQVNADFKPAKPFVFQALQP